MGENLFRELVGESPLMREIRAQMTSAAACDATVLLGGETGTGKEVAAHAIHHASARNPGPFVVIDCGAIPPGLLLAELFGHEKGAFTGAEEPRLGAFEMARGGTVFLDEIGELAPELQPALLRVLDDRTVKRVGGSAYLPVDVRVVSATQKDLGVEVAERRFRADLFFRLSVLEIRMPPLRNRLGDLPRLVDHFLLQLGAAPETAERLRAPTYLDALARHRWPGNVRELRNHIERSLALDAGLAPSPRMATGTLPRFVCGVHAIDRETMRRLLDEHGGHIGRTAAALGVHRRTLERRIKALVLR